MALVFCSECDGRVSSEAEMCVHCGKPFTEERNDFAKLLLTIPYAVYLLASGFIVALGAMDVFVRFTHLRSLPAAEEISVFLLWLVSICVGWIALKTIGSGPRTKRKGAFKDEMTVAIDRKIARRDTSAA